jgi:hypothetical protein
MKSNTEEPSSHPFYLVKVGRRSVVRIARRLTRLFFVRFGMMRSPFQFLIGARMATVKRREWSREDVRSLKGFAKARMSGRQIAKKLKRTPGR